MVTVIQNTPYETRYKGRLSSVAFPKGKYSHEGIRGLLMDQNQIDSKMKHELVFTDGDGSGAGHYGKDHNEREVTEHTTRIYFAQLVNMYGSPKELAFKGFPLRSNLNFRDELRVEASLIELGKGGKEDCSAWFGYFNKKDKKGYQIALRAGIVFSYLKNDREHDEGLASNRRGMFEGAMNDYQDMFNQIRGKIFDNDGEIVLQYDASGQHPYHALKGESLWLKTSNITDYKWALKHARDILVKTSQRPEFIQVKGMNDYLENLGDAQINGHRAKVGDVLKHFQEYEYHHIKVVKVTIPTS